MMDIQEIQEQLITRHRDFIHELRTLTPEEFHYAPEGKWNAGQQVDHIRTSVKPLNRILVLPAAMIRMLFGRANRPSRTYDELVSRYRERLQGGGRAPSRFQPRVCSFEERVPLAKSLMKEVEGVARRAGTFSEKDLDALILPHPLLGKITLREMLYFTIYHVGHHGDLVKNQLSSRT
jgi:DinB superfamily